MVILAVLCFLAPGSAGRERHWMRWPPVTRWRICVSLLTLFWDMRSAAFLFFLAERSAPKLTADDSSGLHMCANDQWEPAMSAKGAEEDKRGLEEKMGAGPGNERPLLCSSTGGIWNWLEDWPSDNGSLLKLWNFTRSTNRLRA